MGCAVGVEEMPPVSPTFETQVTALLRRYCQQNGVALPSDGELAGISTRLWTLLSARGLPPPLADGELGCPGEMSAGEVSPLVAMVFAAVSTRMEFTDLIRQLVKTCLHPEFAVCRDSYREVGAGGTCRRQQFAKAVTRVSGSHCVDCPYWTTLTPSEHALRLAEAWKGEVAEFTENRGVFLPEDFRAFRAWLHAARRSGAFRVGREDS